MKIRNGFVSNSSSSSFLLVGFQRDNLVKDILDKLNLSEAYKTTDSEDRDKLFIAAGFHDYGYGTRKSNNDVVIIEGYDSVKCIGIEALDELNNGKTVQSVGDILIDKLHTLSEDLEIASVDAELCFGTSSSEL